MSRIRSIHPGLATDERFMSMSIIAKAAWPLLWTECDDHGVFEWKPIVLKARLLPADAIDFDALLAEWVTTGSIQKYEYDGKWFGVVRNFCRYQRPKKPAYRHPLPDEFRTFAGLTHRSAEPVPNQSATDGEKSPQMKEGGGRREEEGGKIDATHQLTREEVDKIEAEVRREAGLESDNSPGLLVVGPILDLLKKGYTLQGHILPAARKLRASGKKLSTWTYLAKMVEGAAAETTAIKPAAPVVDPVVFVPQADWRWPGCAERYERACGLKAKASESEAGVPGRRFPKRIVDEVEADPSARLNIPPSLKRTLGGGVEPANPIT